MILTTLIHSQFISSIMFASSRCAVYLKATLKSEVVSLTHFKMTILLYHKKPTYHTRFIIRWDFFLT